MDSGWRFGHVDQSGREVIPLEYKWADSFADGLAPVTRPESHDTEYVDHTGNVVFTVASWLSADRTVTARICLRFSGGRARICYDGGKSFVSFLDVNGRQIGPDMPYTGAGRCSEGLTSVSNRDDKAGFVDATGQLGIPLRFDSAGDFHEGRCRVRTKETWQYIDKKGVVAARGRRRMSGTTRRTFTMGWHGCTLEADLEERLHAPAWWRGGTWYFINRSGAIVAICRQDRAGANRATARA